MGPLTPSQAKTFRTYEERLSGEEIYPALRSLAMGDCHAVELAQNSHLAILVQAGWVHEGNLISMHLLVPRSSDVMIGVVIDDLAGLEVVSRLWVLDQPIILSGPRT